MIFDKMYCSSVFGTGYRLVVNNLIENKSPKISFSFHIKFIAEKELFICFYFQFSTTYRR